MNPQMDILRIKPSILGVNAFDFWPIPSWLFHSIDSPTGQSGSFLSRTMICIAKFLFELNSRHDSAIKICRFALPMPPKLPSNSPTCLPRWEFHHEMFLHIPPMNGSWSARLSRSEPRAAPLAAEDTYHPSTELPKVHIVFITLFPSLSKQSHIEPIGGCVMKSVRYMKICLKDRCQCFSRHSKNIEHPVPATSATFNDLLERPLELLSQLGRHSLSCRTMSISSFFCVSPRSRYVQMSAPSGCPGCLSTMKLAC